MKVKITLTNGHTIVSIKESFDAFIETVCCAIRKKRMVRGGNSAINPSHIVGIEEIEE